MKSNEQSNENEKNDIRAIRISKIHNLKNRLTSELTNSQISITMEDILNISATSEIDNEEDLEYHKKFMESIKATNSNSSSNTADIPTNINNNVSNKSTTESSLQESDLDSDESGYIDGTSNYDTNYEAILTSLETRRRLPEIDHSSIDYPLIIKCIYREVDELRKLKSHEVDHIRLIHNGIHAKKLKNRQNIQSKTSEVENTDIPKPILKFSQCGLPSGINKYLQSKDIIKPFPIQMQSIPILMSGKDMIGIAETGSGKTLAYVLPLIRHVIIQKSNNYPFNTMERSNTTTNTNIHYVTALIIVPTRELALQVYKQTKILSNTVKLNSTVICGGFSISNQLNKLRSGCDIVVCTPGRLIDIISLNYKRVSVFQYISYIVIDEGDRLLDMGFAPQLTNILSIIRPDRQCCIFSATFPPIVEQLVNNLLTNPIQVIVGQKGQLTSNVKQHIELWKDDQEKFYRLLQLLGEWSEFGLIVIFCNRQVEVDELYAQLLPYGYKCFTLHSGQDNNDRHSNLMQFSKSNKVEVSSGNNILIATSIFSRGLHIDNILVVINYGPPHHIEDYIHRVGRTGRAGKFGTSFTLLLSSEISQCFDLIELTQKYDNDIVIIDQKVIDSYNNEKMKFCFERSEQTRNKRNRKSNFGFGGKGYKFSKDEKTSLQLLKDDTKKILGLVPENNLEYEPINEYDNDIHYDTLNNNRQTTTTNIDPNLELTQSLPLFSNNTEYYQNIPINTKDTTSQQVSVTNKTNDAEKALLQAISAARLIDISKSVTNSSNINSINSTSSGNTINDSINSHHLLSGRIVDTFEINDYPSYIRQRIVHKDILKCVNENCGVVCQVKGVYIPPLTTNTNNSLNILSINNNNNLSLISSSNSSSILANQSVLRLGENRKLYVEINGPNHIKVQKAIHEFNVIIDMLKKQHQQSNNKMNHYNIGKYSLSNRLNR
ncbi:DEAD DEAH box helicase family protein [Cryptosporidium andersoni]|uniref:RNA helicase n=1 Tax=Cryptosporidium andersoni TaxID=117008 RepID=A0A1J4MSX5_9CRYT|nr:DEAD DEAH box helicase family protein [Cryptosporidium andersoni]